MAYYMVNKIPAEYLELPKLLSPQLPASSESSLQSLDGFNGDFKFDAPQFALVPILDLRVTGVFKMLSGPATRKGPELFLSSTAGFNPTFAFEAPHPAP